MGILHLGSDSFLSVNDKSYPDGILRIATSDFEDATSFKVPDQGPYTFGYGKEFMNVVQDGDTFIIRAQPDAGTRNSHFRLKQPENVCLIKNTASGLVLFGSSDTQSGNRILEARKQSTDSIPGASGINDVFIFEYSKDMSLPVIHNNTIMHERIGALIKRQKTHFRSISDL